MDLKQVVLTASLLTPLLLVSTADDPVETSARGVSREAARTICFRYMFNVSCLLGSNAFDVGSA